jgi:hypothetical protein
MRKPGTRTIFRDDPEAEDASCLFLSDGMKIPTLSLCRVETAFDKLSPNSLFEIVSAFTDDMIRVHFPLNGVFRIEPDIRLEKVDPTRLDALGNDPLDIALKIRQCRLRGVARSA